MINHLALKKNKDHKKKFYEVGNHLQEHIMYISISKQAGKSRL